MNRSLLGGLWKGNQAEGMGGPFRGSSGPNQGYGEGMSAWPRVGVLPGRFQKDLFDCMARLLPLLARL